MDRRTSAGFAWFLACLVCGIAGTTSFAYFDVAAAKWCFHHIGSLAALGTGLGNSVLLSIEGGTVLILIVVRLVRGHLSRLNEAIALASLTSICTYAVNSGVLKVVFGVPTPANVLLQGARHSFHLLAGTADSSFPSGHMILAAAFAGVLMRLYPRSIWPLAGLLLLGAALLILGNWHFISDVIAGAFLGISTGVLAGELWRIHPNQDPHQAA